jgi:cyanophycinase
MRYLKIIIATAFVLSVQVLFAQSSTIIPSGKLFIIGGGDRPPRLMKALIEAADLKSGDYTVVLPMSSANPDTSFI